MNSAGALRAENIRFPLNSQPKRKAFKMPFSSGVFGWGFPLTPETGQCPLRVLQAPTSPHPKSEQVSRKPSMLSTNEPKAENLLKGH